MDWICLLSSCYWRHCNFCCFLKKYQEDHIRQSSKVESSRLEESSRIEASSLEAAMTRTFIIKPDTKSLTNPFIGWVYWAQNLPKIKSAVKLAYVGIYWRDIKEPEEGALRF